MHNIVICIIFIFFVTLYLSIIGTLALGVSHPPSSTLRLILLFPNKTAGRVLVGRDQVPLHLLPLLLPPPAATRVMPSLTIMTTSDAANETSGKPPGPTTTSSSKEKPGVEAAAAAAAAVKETPSPPSEMLTPMGQAIQFAEKKIRNLEKRIVSEHTQREFRHLVNVAHVA